VGTDVAFEGEAVTGKINVGCCEGTAEMVDGKLLGGTETEASVVDGECF
jgi:hypothetical protein